MVGDTLELRLIRWFGRLGRAMPFEEAALAKAFREVDPFDVAANMSQALVPIFDETWIAHEFGAVFGLVMHAHVHRFDLVPDALVVMNQISVFVILNYNHILFTINKLLQVIHLLLGNRSESGTDQGS